MREQAEVSADSGRSKVMHVISVEKHKAYSRLLVARIVQRDSTTAISRMAKNRLNR